MADLTALRQLSEQRFFGNWDEYIAPENIEASEANVRCLIDALITLGPRPTEEAVHRAVDECIRQFNKIDDGWICTTEREDIYEQVSRVVGVCGFDCQEEWLDARDW